MCIRLLVADRRESLLAEWKDAFAGVPQVEFRLLAPGDLGRIPGVDAELLPGMLAHERFGGVPRPGVAQILSSGGALSLAPWIVTVPFRPASLESVAHPDDEDGELNIPFPIPPLEGEIYTTFAEVFGRVLSFNLEQERIRTLGIHLEVINAPLGDPREEALAVRRAYLDVCRRSGSTAAEG